MEKRLFSLVCVIVMAIIAASIQLNTAWAESSGPKSGVNIIPKHCSTAVFGKNATADGSVLMCHTEDPGANACAHLTYWPRKQHPEGAKLELGKETIPQASVTYMYYSSDMFDYKVYNGLYLNGINEHGVAVTTEAIFTKEADDPVKEGGLTILEIMNLIIERCKTSREGVDLIAEIQKKYGTSGWFFEIAYIIADPNEAWIVDATARHWVAKRVPDDGAVFYANELMIEDDYDMASPDLIDYAVKRGWCEKPPAGKKINFKQVYGDKLGEAYNKKRQERFELLLRPKLGSVTVNDLMAFVRDHYEGSVMNYHYPPHAHAIGGHYTLCNANTRAAQVWQLRNYMPVDIGCVMWIAFSSPCVSVFQPIWAGARGDTPPEYRKGTNKFSLDSAWWAFESLQRMVDVDYKNRIKFIKDTWRKREQEIFKMAVEREAQTMTLWQTGQKKEASKLLTDLQNTILRGNYLKALNLLGVLNKGPAWDDVGPCHDIQPYLRLRPSVGALGD
jgi:dipeptidase